MVDVLTLAIVAVGTVLLFAGAALSVYGVALLGAVIGGGGGYLLAPTIGAAAGVEGNAAIAAAVGVGVIAGVLISYSLLSVVVAVAGFVTGAFLGLFVVTPIFVDGAWYVEAAAALGVGILGGFLGMLMTKTTLVGVTSFLGAALASRQLAVPNLEAAANGPAIEPLLFDFADPIFLGLLVLGLLSQIGLFKFGYVTKLTAILPGARIIRNRGDNDKAAGG